MLGAGINGAALARELALSGVSVVVVDADDVACGATAWSTRLIHGGLRYLEHGEIGLVRESLAERDRLVRLAPHLVRPLPFYLPVETRFGGMAAAMARLVGCDWLARAWSRGRGRGRWTVAAGLAVYDLLARASRGGGGWPSQRTVRAGGDGLPPVDAARFPWAGIYADAQLLHPERFTVELLVDARCIADATGAGFAVYTHHRARWLSGDRLRLEPGIRAGNACPPDGRDLHAAAVINATGAWVDRTLAEVFAGEPGAPRGQLIGGTKGSHLVLDASPLREALGAFGVYAEAADGRPVFVLPFGPRLVLVGTTDLPFAGDPATARADEHEIAYLLAAVARLFPRVAPGRDRVQQHYCGVRPLPSASIEAAGSGVAPGAITRRHMLVRHPRSPLPTWSIVGGKLTTCRSLAEAAAAEVLAAVGLPVTGTSRERLLPGACEGTGREAAVATVRDLLVAGGMGGDDARRAAERTVGIFGSRGPAAVAGRAGRPLLRGLSIPAAAVGFCVREEWAVTLADIVERRLTMQFDEQLSVAALEDVAEELVRCGTLSRERTAAEVAACATRLREHHGRTLPPVPAEPADRR